MFETLLGNFCAGQGAGFPSDEGLGLGNSGFRAGLTSEEVLRFEDPGFRVSELASKDRVEERCGEGAEQRVGMPGGMDVFGRYRTAGGTDLLRDWRELQAEEPNAAQEGGGGVRSGMKAEAGEQGVERVVGGEAGEVVEEAEGPFRAVAAAVREALYRASGEEAHGFATAALVLDARSGMRGERAAPDLAREVGPGRNGGHVLIRQRSWKDGVLARMGSNP